MVHVRTECKFFIFIFAAIHSPQVSHGVTTYAYTPLFEKQSYKLPDFIFTKRRGGDAEKIVCDTQYILFQFQQVFPSNFRLQYGFTPNSSTGKILIPILFSFCAFKKVPKGRKNNRRWCKPP